MRGEFFRFLSLKMDYIIYNTDNHFFWLLIVCRLFVFDLIILQIMEDCNYGYYKSIW